MDRKKKVIFFAVCLFMMLPLNVGTGHAVMIDDRAGGAIYWGGKYVNMKPSRYGDVIGRRSAVDQMEVILKDNVMTVKITGPYFFNYVHNINRTRDASPGDLYISSKGWKVSGSPPYTKDIFEFSEGWDYVVSLENKKVYLLNFSDIVMTSALPYANKYRAHQAWRGGYGDVLDDAAITLTETGLTFIFRVRNMRLESDIGLHWTMKCGNDIIEGSALIPPVAMTPEPATEVPADPIDVTLAADPATSELPAVPIAASGSPAALLDAYPSAAGGSSGFSFVGPLLATAIIPAMTFGSHHSDDSSPPGIGPARPVVPPEPVLGSEAPAVPEPSIALLLLAGLSGIFTRKRSIK